MQRQRKTRGRLLGAIAFLLALAAPVRADLLVVANEHAGTLSILDHKAGKVIGTLQVGGIHTIWP